MGAGNLLSTIKTPWLRRRQPATLDPVELAPRIHIIGGKRGGHVRAFLVEDGSDLALIDTLYETDARLVLAEIRRLGRSVVDLKRIAITHAHRSHLGGIALLKRESGARVLSHEWEADIIGGQRKAQPVTVLPRLPLRAWFPFQVGLALGRGKHPACPVDEPLREGDELAGLHVLHTPGHTPGHLAFWAPEHRLLLTGDAIATWPRFEAGWPAFTLNEQQHRASVRRMAELEPTAIAVGHGDPIRGQAAERLHSLVEQ
jgi:glyoxylase-like metal-dependent hydrolase (beta-lactamase superfamily II)